MPRSILTWLRTADRRGSWLAALAAGVWFASATQPITWAQVATTTQALQFSYPDVYNELHARPFGFCDSYEAQRAAALADIATAPDGGLLYRMRAYNIRIRSHYAQDCGVQWRVYQNPANFQKVFSQNYLLYFTVGKLGLSEVYLGLATLVVRWLGVLAFVVLCVSAWPSLFAPAVAWAISSMLLNASFAQMLGVGMPGWSGVMAVPGHALYPLVTALLAVAMVRMVPSGPRALRHPAFWLLPLAFAAHGLLYLLIDPPIARMLTWLVIGFLAVFALARRAWSLMACVALCVVLNSAAWGWYLGPSRDIYSAATKYDHVSSEAYTPFMMYMGLLERPSPFGLFYMDEVFGWGYDQDPVAGVVAPHLTVHHSYATIGQSLFRYAVVTEPAAVVEAVARRLLVQVFHRPLWYSWDLRTDWVYTILLVGLLAVNGVALLFPRWLVLLTPLSLGILLNQFAVNSVMTLVHTHARWNQLGVALMFGAAPLFVFATVGMVRDWRHVGPPTWFIRLSRLRAARAAVLLLLVVAAAGAVKAQALLVDERENLLVWMKVHRPPVDGLDIEGILESIEQRRTVTGDRDGALAMWASSILLLYDFRYFSAFPFDEAAKAATQVRRVVEPTEFSFVDEGSAHDGICWRLRGVPGGPFSYLLASQTQNDVAGAKLLVEGDLAAGGLSVGLQAGGRWVEAHSVSQPGAFSLVIEPAAAGPFDIIIANNQNTNPGATRACVRTIAWVEPTAGAEKARTRDSLRERREAYYRAALAAAPNNPHYLYLARFMQVRGWEEHLREGLRRFPTAPYAPGALASLWFYGPTVVSSDDRAGRLYRSDLARRYEAAVAGFLQRTGGANPLVEATPRIVGGSAETSAIEDADGRQLVRLRLPANGAVRVSPQPTWGSHVVQLLAYIHVVDGSAAAGLELGDEGEQRQVSPVELDAEAQVVAGRYVRFDSVTVPGDSEFALWLRAGDEGAVIEVADYYPMLYSPQGYYTSLLPARNPPLPGMGSSN